MNILTGILLVLAGLLLLLTVLLMIPVRLELRWQGRPEAVLRWLWLRFPLDLEKTGEKTPAKKKKSPQTAPEEEQTGGDRKKKLPLSFGELMQLALELVKKLFSLLGELLRHIHAEDLMLRWAVTGEDAAGAAIRSGRINGAVYSAYAFLNHVFTMQAPDLIIRPDFLGQEDRIFFRCCLRLRPVWAVVMAVKLAFVLVKKVLSLRMQNNEEQFQQK